MQTWNMAYLCHISLLQGGTSEQHPFSWAYSDISRLGVGVWHGCVNWNIRHNLCRYDEV